MMTQAKYPPDSGDKQKAEEALEQLEHSSSSTNMNDNEEEEEMGTTKMSTIRTSDVKEDEKNPRPTTTSNTSTHHYPDVARDDVRRLMGESLQPPAGCLWAPGTYDNDRGDRQFIPQVALHATDGRRRKRVLVLCTGGTLTMAPDPRLHGALAPVEGALSRYMESMTELHADHMPEITLHEYAPFYDSSDLGPADWARLASDIRANYLHFDGFVVLTGTDTMAYCATALSFMLENLGKPVVFSGSQIREYYFYYCTCRLRMAWLARFWHVPLDG